MKVVLDTNVLFVSVSEFSQYYPIYDPDDDKFVDAAVAGNADFRVTDDRHFRVLKKITFPKVKVVSADEFLILVQ